MNFKREKLRIGCHFERSEELQHFCLCDIAKKKLNGIKRGAMRWNIEAVCSGDRDWAECGRSFGVKSGAREDDRLRLRAGWNGERERLVIFVDDDERAMVLVFEGVGVHARACSG